MLNSESSGLVSEKLKRWRDDLEAASWDVELRAKILLRNTRNEALKAVKSYLAEAWKDMGPSFIEKTAEDVAKMGNVGQGIKGVHVSEIVEHAATFHHSMFESNQPGINGNDNRATPGGLHNMSVNEPGSKQDVQGVENTVAPHDRIISSVEPPVDGEDSRVKASIENYVSVDEPGQRGEKVSENLGDGSRVATGGTQNEQTLFKCRRVGVHSGCSGETFRGRVTRVRITNTEEVDEDVCMNKYHYFPTPEVDKIKAALESSFVSLHAVVRDPLPEALRIAENARSQMQRDPGRCGSHGDKVNVGPMSMDKTEQTSLGPNGVEKIGCGDGHPKREDFENQRYLSLVILNPSLPNDSIGLSRVSLHRPYLSSPKGKKISPLKKYEITKVVRRRQRKKWSRLEEDTLRTGVEEFGKGNWKVILNTYCNIFEDRTEVDLKDK